MARSPKKDFHNQGNVAGSDMGAAIGAFQGLTSGDPVTMATTFAAAFGPVLADVPSMINPSGASKAAAEQRRQQLLAENEERRLRKERERQEELEAERKKKEEEEKKRLARKVKQDKITKEKTLERDTKRISAGLLTQEEALQALSTGKAPRARGTIYGQTEGMKQFDDQVASAFTRRRRRRNRASSKIKGGGTKKVCLPKAKVMNMSPEERRKVVAAKRSAASKGKYKRSSKSFVKGARKKGATLRDWFEKENWVQVSNPSKKCGEA